MNRIIANISINYQRCLFVCATILLVLLTSCPVKSGIKTLAGIPVHTEQSTAKGTDSFVGNNAEKCSSIEVNLSQISQTISTHSGDLLPAALLTAVFLFLFGFDILNTQHSHPLYSNLKIPGTLPIFLQYQRLII